MNRGKFEQTQFELSVQSGMNQRYHQQREAFWSRLDKLCRSSVGVLAVLDAMFAGIAAYSHGSFWTPLSVFVAILAALVAIVLNVVPLADNALHHGDLFRRWCDFREEVDLLEFEFADPPTNDLVERTKQLNSKMHRICGSEPAPNQDLLMKCYQDEMRSRQTPETQQGPSISPSASMAPVAVS